VLLRQINAGELFGELAAIDKAPRSSGIVAMTDVTVARMSAAVFRASLHAHPDICDQVLALLAGQIRMLANRVNEFSTLDVRHRIHAELLRLSRTEPADPARAVISPPPVHAEIAARISTRREAVARELKALERDNLIERRRGALVLTDVDRLRRMINEAIEAG
jgi:CRP-like cAMP-binding protein